jgi:hypothetical protein
LQIPSSDKVSNLCIAYSYGGIIFAPYELSFIQNLLNLNSYIPKGQAKTIGHKKMHHIVILVHRYFPFDNSLYFLREIAEIWRKEGLRVSVLYGLGTRADADLAILHVDMTVVPEDYLAFIRQYPVTINGSVMDISKRRISSNLVCRGDGYKGQVIVKTNNNCRGGGEAKIAKRGPLLQKYAYSLRNKLPWSWRAKLSDYPILESVSQVPRAVWHNPDLVVEQFLPERRDGFYCLRTWFFFGDKETNSLSYSDHPIVKFNNVLRREKVAEVPDELRQMRRGLGFDFGKFDYAIVNGRVVLYDANWTPTLGSFSKEQVLPRIRLLAEGIWAYL